MAIPALPRLAGGQRSDWLAVADALLDAARRHATPGHGRIVFPGAEGGYGAAVDGLEGFARVFLLAGFRIAGARGEGVDDLIAFFAEGVRTGVDPDAADRWVRMDEHAQAKVEAASLALALDLTREWIWDSLDAQTQERLVAYLAPVVGDATYPQTNWVWFRIVVQTFLRSVGGPWSADDIAADLARHDSFVRADGWLSDGDERAFDHYVGWALHVYPVLWPRMTGATDLVGDRTAGDVARLDRFLQDAVRLIGADGSPLLQGRSLIYRFAAAAPLWAGIIAEVPSTGAGRLLHAAGAVVDHFVTRGAPNADGILTLGWHGEWRSLAQSYSGPGSPYWAVKGLMGIALPADHPVWSAVDEPLPIAEADDLRAIPAAGWIVSGTRADGIVRVINHGTDKARPGTSTADSPLYARISYSTATAPLLDDLAWSDPLEQAVVLVDAAGRVTHRTALEPLGAIVHEGVGVAASASDVHLVDIAPTTHRHGAGLAGAAQSLGRMTVTSLVRGAWEVRIARLDHVAPGVDVDLLRVRMGGWALAGAAPVHATSTGAAEAHANGRVSGIRALTPEATSRVTIRRGASPLGDTAAIPVLTWDAVVGVRFAGLVTLAGASTAEAAETLLEIVGDEPVAVVTWPDGLSTRTPLTDSGAPRGAHRHSRARSGARHAIAKEQHA
ncbi:hypothetical protein SAMN04487848_0083 [Microbacterium sp. ru370.1]|uniref:DUF2264 domain-containing protein n=1 Tax=unclassified Microbacterium TaxID=2609290 RepID=UPI00088D9B43|nr:MULTISPECIES: DUF2264 domain-containing protein [unclassified Microbacterium]SDO26402.1 hypothetical protein SAMN04487848_0083 [Microbacterium sp. ru370.1]SIT74206.1 hypothetical protein SAMN05880579_0079 [Microbacterium sp. RU1D]